MNDDTGPVKGPTPTPQVGEFGYSTYTGAPYEDNPTPLPDPGPVIPLVHDVRPEELQASPSLTLCVLGTDFEDLAVVKAGVLALDTTFVSSVQLSADGAALAAGEKVLTVTNPSGGVSNPVTLTITA